MQIKTKLIISIIFSFISLILLVIYSVPFLQSLVFALIIFVLILLFSSEWFHRELRRSAERREEDAKIRRRAYLEEQGKQNAISDHKSRERLQKNLRNHFFGVSSNSNNAPSRKKRRKTRK